jgi:hypothetical protein
MYKFGRETVKIVWEVRYEIHIVCIVNGARFYDDIGGNGGLTPLVFHLGAKLR